MGLNSSSVIKIVDLLCEGPIEGIEGGRQGIYLDESPLQGADGEDFVDKKLVSHELNRGTRGQDYLPQAEGRTSSVQDVGLQVGKNYEEITRTTNNDGTTVKARNYGHGTRVVQVDDPNVDRIDLIFTIGPLYSTAQEGLAKGQLFNAQIFFKVFIQAKGQGFVQLKNAAIDDSSDNIKIDRNGTFFIDGISTTGYQFKIPGIRLKGKGPWNIKVEKYPDLFVGGVVKRSYKGDIPHSQEDAPDIDQDIFRATYDEFIDENKKKTLASGRKNGFVWTSIIKHENIRTAYPFSACVGMDISTEEFPSLPTRSYLVRGKKVRIPHNAVPRDDGSLEFIGNFNGSLGDMAWTTCPVCIFYDLLTNKRFGAGHFIEASNLSWVDLYPLAQYANQRVNGEPRFACNVQVASQADAYSVLQDFASVFRGMMYWQSNVIQLTADHGNLDGTDVSPVHVFSNSNVVDGVFTYSGSSLKTRSTSIRVRYSDPDNLYKPNVLVVEDASLISRYGYQIKEILAFGCTSKKQAKRLGRWMLKTEELDASTVAFSVGLEGVLVFPGQVFAIQDSLRAAIRLSGRVSSSTTTSIVADQSITLPAGENPQLTCVLSNGTVESREIDIVNTNGTTITVVSAFSSAPLAQAIYSIKTSQVTEQKFRCLSVADNADGTFGITAIEFNDSIYGAADFNEEIEFEDVTIIDEKPGKPHNLNIAFQLIEKDGGITNRAIASWQPSGEAFTAGYEVSWRTGDGTYTNLTTSKVSLEVDGIQPNTRFQIKVRAVGIGFPKKRSAYARASAITPTLPTIIEGNRLIENISDLTITPISDTQAVLHWRSPVTEKLNNLVAVIKHSDKTDGTGSFVTSANLVEVPASANTATVPRINGEYLVKLRDETTTQKSITTVSVLLNTPDVSPKLVIYSPREHQIESPFTQKFRGEKTDIVYNSSYDGLILNTTELVNGKFLGRYDFPTVQTLPGKFEVRLDRVLATQGLYPDDTIDSRTALVDTWPDWDGALAEETSTQVYFRASDDVSTNDQLLLEADPDVFLLEDGNNLIYESSLTFGPWRVLDKSTFVGRTFQFKAELESLQPDQTPLVDALGYDMWLPSRVENTAATGSAESPSNPGYYRTPDDGSNFTVTFTNAFYETPSIGITALNLASGDYYELVSTARTGFTIRFKNSSGQVVSKDFKYTAAGFGSEQT